ncbi:MAG: BNR-4 repeat-containing protein, partial [Prolixibacteraceae bacterium]
GRGRMGYKYRSVRPHAIDTFRQVREEEMTYPQPWFVPGKGLFHFFTKYTGMRELYYENSNRGFEWSEDQKLAAVKRPEDKQAGHYQVSDVHHNKLGTFFNWHPNGNVDKRTNLYYLETTDFGETWHSADGRKTAVPVEDVDHHSRVAGFFSDGKNVYLKDMDFDESGNPVCLFLVSNGHEPGPANDPRVWKTARWTGRKWEIRDVCTSGHNYDMGSLYIGKNNWQVIAPTEPGPQPWGVGGETVIWQSRNKGKKWKKAKQVTQNSELNNSYLRRPENAHPGFYGFWANGNPDEFSKSELFFLNKDGKVFQLPYTMETEFCIPVKN